MARKSNKVKQPTKKAKTGLKPEVLKLEGDWQDNIRKSIQAAKPAKGWPKA
jgi:hypothetical protein